VLAYLVRHGEAVGERDDPARPLSKRGERAIGDLAWLLAHHFELMPGHIFHSPKSRAAQTASILSRILPRAPEPVESEGLAPMDDPGVWAQRLEVMDLDTMLVGHLPHLPRLASVLLLDSGRRFLEFTPGTVVCLERTGEWKVKWMITPDILKPL